MRVLVILLFKCKFPGLAFLSNVQVRQYTTSFFASHNCEVDLYVFSPYFLTYHFC